MMKDIEIKINRETRMVDLSKSIIGNDGENLQGNLVFSFVDDFVKGQARLEYVIDDEKKYALLLKGEDNYYIPIKSVMTKAGTIDMQLVVTEGTNENEIPIFKSNMFYVTCRTSINAEVEEEEGYYSWIEIANTKLNEVDEAIEELTSQSNYAKEQGDYAKEQGTNAKNVADDTQKKAEEGKFNGKSLEFIWQGTKLGVRLEGQEEYQFVDLQGVQGEIGATGEPFKIKKTYASVSEMNADFRNMTFGDYVMIASSVEVEDNAKLYTRGESAWIFISDFSGAMGIRGETGLTPNIKIGEVKTLEAGSQAKVTRSGSNEEPVFNFELPKGDKGDNYVLTEEDKVEIGEKVNTEYEERIAENEKDIIDIESYLDSLTPKAPPVKGELVHITDALNLPTFENKIDGNVKQEGEPSPTSPQEIEVIEGDLSFKVNGKNLFDLNYAIEKNYISNGSERTPVYTIDNNGYLNNTATNANLGIIYLNKISLKAGTYTLQYVLNLTTTGERVVLLRGKNVTTNTEIFNTNVFDLPTGDVSKNFTFTLSEDSDISFAFTPKNGTSTLVIKDIQLEPGEVATEIEPYQEQIVYLDLKGNFVGAINDNIKDYLVTDKKKYWLVKNVMDFDLDDSISNVSFTISQNLEKYNTTYISIYVPDILTNSRVISDYFTYKNLWNNDVEGCWVGNSLHIAIRISKDKVKTLEDLKTWLSGKKVKFYYQLAEPQIIDLGELPEPIKTFEGTNNIQLLANLDTEIEVKYALDIKKYTDNKLAEISAQII